MLVMKVEINSDQAMIDFGQQLATKLDWPFCLELVGDIGAGKTTLTKGLVQALDGDNVSSPSFTINNRYDLANNRQISHFDFYRLGQAGVLSQELVEDLNNDQVSVVIEWGQIIQDVLPKDKVQLIISKTDHGRLIESKDLQ